MGSASEIAIAQHWDRAYGRGSATPSWFQAQPLPSLRMLDAAGVCPADSLIDVGGGASTLVDALLQRGHSDLTVLDISSHGLHIAQRRLRDDARRVRWLVADLLTWRPHRSWQVWHDRAVLHFFTSDAARQRYVRALDTATTTGSLAILATFAPDGPQRCSGLPVARYDTAQLAALLGSHWRLLTHTREEHTTPAGVTQPFIWTAFRRA